MTTLAKLVCTSMLFAVAAQPSASLARDAGVRDQLPLLTACPDALKALPENLYPAWRALDSAAEVVVDFKLDGDRISDVSMSGGHGSYMAPVRRAVRAMKCGRPGEKAYAVRFRITFQYPEDPAGATTAMLFADVAPQT